MGSAQFVRPSRVQAQNHVSTAIRSPATQRNALVLCLFERNDFPKCPASAQQGTVGIPGTQGAECVYRRGVVSRRGGRTHHGPHAASLHR
jgi:hypothetical protein